MEEIPPELCLRVMELIPCLTTLRNFIISQQRVFRIFSTYQVTVLKSVIRNQFGENAKEVVFLATYTNRVSGATSVETRVNTIMRLHRFTWVDQQLNSNILRNLTEIGLVVDKLTVIFTSMAAELWKKAVHSTPPSSFPHAESRMRRAIYHYWILCRVYSEFVPARRHFFWASSLNPDRRTFEEFYRPFTIRQLLGMAFFEYCFFPRFMVDVCMDCTEGTCDGQIHKVVFSGGPEELVRIHELHYSDRSLTRDLSQEWTPKGLLEDLLHGIVLEPASIEPIDEFSFIWVIFELDGIDEQQLSSLKLICGE